MKAMKTALFVALALILACYFALAIACGDDDDDNDSDSASADDDTGPDDDVDDDADDDVNDDADDDIDDDADDDDTVPIDLGGLIPGPGEEGFNSDLEQKALRYAQQFHGMMAYPFGMSLEVYISNQDMRDLVDDWLANSQIRQGFEEYTGVPVYDVMDRYGEFGDLGMFGGVASLGDVFHYAIERDRPDRDETLLGELRQNVLDLMEALHICVAITGVRGVTVRGIIPKGLPGGDPETTPLFNEFGNPLPVLKGNQHVRREDNSTEGLYPNLIWIDNTSKDQLDGYILSMGAVWDVVVNDPDIPDDFKLRIQDDVAGIGEMLMEVAPETGRDLTIRDADGRLVKYHDLNPLEMQGVPIPPFLGIGNGFNAVMGLGIIKTIAFITGDQRFMDFYDELLIDRDFPRYVDQTFKFAYVGPHSNWSNVNMAYVAMYPLLRYEADHGTFSYWREVLDRDLWKSYYPAWDVDTGNQAFFNIIFASFAPGATDDEAADRAAPDLMGFPDPPYWNAPAIINCDENELAAGQCLAVDGQTIITLAGTGIGGRFLSQSVGPVPRSIRPPSNFNWRSSPHDVNGGGGTRLNPGGDFHGAYWLGRYMRRSNSSAINVSPHAR
jgi:hypothetical protein